jgi:hypothetical protein
MSMRTSFLRRAALGAVLAAAGAAAASAATGRAIDIGTPDGAIAAFRKIQCSTEDARPTVYYWSGETYSRVQGEPDRLLFRFEGMNVRQCTTVKDPVRGTGFRQVSREILFYMDPATGKIVDEWKNPWTGETVEVLHIANDPVNFRAPIFPLTAEGKPYQTDLEVMGDHWWSTITVPLFYRNPLAGDFQDYVGGMYQATEMFNFFGRMSDLTDPKQHSADVNVAWARVSDWLPWMKMRGRTGLVYFNGAGRKLDRYEDLPAGMRAAIEARAPIYREPPPVDDQRPNETSWTYFKKRMEAARPK